MLRVFSGGRKNADDQERMAEFGKRAAPFVRELVDKCSTCGLTWGSTLWHVVNSIASSAKDSADHRKGWADRRIEFIPLAGEPLGRDPTSFSSSSLAAVLGRSANGDEYHARSLGMVPAFIPERRGSEPREAQSTEFTATELQGVWKLIELVPSYGEIFGRRRERQGKEGKRTRQRPIAYNLDMILTSVGPANQVLGFGGGKLCSKSTLDRLQRLVIGDMGGVCFSRPDLTAKEQRELEVISARWTGLKRDHLDACAAAAAADSSRPGVVVVSGGLARAQFIYDAVKLASLNYLIIDDTLAAALSRLLGG
jgi:DNA-binding transcriptional regulator LsrR (DeoR family)